MPALSPTHQPAANAVVDEAVRITADSARRTTETARAALEQTRGYVDQAADINREAFALWPESTDAWLKAAFELQNAAATSTISWLNASLDVTKGTLERYVELSKKGQSTALKAYDTSAKFVAATLIRSE